MVERICDYFAGCLLMPRTWVQAGFANGTRHPMDLAQVFGDRPAAVARELTKTFEEVRRGSVTALVAWAEASPPRGEITVLLGPPAEEMPMEEAGLDAQLRAALAGQSVRDAAALVAAATGLPRKLVYARALALSGGG